MNVSRKADRAEMARRLEEAAKAHGVPYIREDGWNEEPRTIAVSFTLPHGLRLSVHLEGDSAQQREGTHVLSWHGVEAGWRLRPDCFEDVNSFHGHKATDICYDFGTVITLLNVTFRRAMAGEVFIAEEKEPL